MIDKYSENDLKLWNFPDGLVILEPDLKALLNEIRDANLLHHSKYAINKILRREGIEIPSRAG